ncbi:hypothetical protein [Alkalihalobacterium chitinilyticum]|uniref:Uncharacterized protein n=1 Tax=Alkalihalobacterium chitinilyticum TaxID=2980103 RepID=A0ABT5VLN0_9BACI|nr:hypothetical protein [Alkalihalobacterium chitinilyticum]MDE5416146.1 hypothetical protein [Alkalihalobacterium chitinilyticum]
MSEWLQGGPFLEVSFLMEIREDQKKLVNLILNNLSLLPEKIELVDENIDEKIDCFLKGEPFDETDSTTPMMHLLKLHLYVQLTRRRKATLQIETFSSNDLLVNFWFYGSTSDAKEWGQIGINEEEYVDFTNLLIHLFSVYRFKVGGIGFEVNVLDLFNSTETYPNECYQFENMLPNDVLQNSSHFIQLIWNEKYKKVSNIPFNYRKLHHEGVLISLRSFAD